MLKIVLIDDELVVLQGIQHLLQEQLDNCIVAGSFQNPRDALGFLTENPYEVDVVVTDIKMPYISGVDLIELIHRINDQIVVIAMSAYTDYEYIRQAMKNGAVDYLLKPCRYKEIIEIFQKVEQRKREKQLVQVYEQKEKILLGMIKGEENTCLKGLWEELEVIYGCVLWNRRKLSLEQEAVLKKTVQERRKGELIWAREDNNVWIFSKDKGEAIPVELLDAYENGCLVHLEWGEETFREKVGQLKSMQEFCQFNNWKGLVFENVWSEQVNKPVELEQFFSLERIASILLKGREDQLKLSYQEALHRMGRERSGYEPIRLKSELIHFCYALEEKIKKGKSGMFLIKSTEQEKILSGIRGSTTFEAGMECFKAYLMEIVSYFQEKAKIPSYVRTASAYMEANYMQDLSLQDVADHVALNPWYFSSQFKKFMGIAMGEYLNEVRIDASVNLMKEQDLKLGEIADLVGFKDSAYFSSVFKKKKGMSPKEFRMKDMNK